MQRIGFIVLPGFQMMSVAALSVFEPANGEIGEPVYDVRLLSETGGSHPQLDRLQRRDGAVRRCELRHVDGRRQRRAGSLTPGVIEFLRQALRAIPASCRDVRRGVRPGRSRPARRPRATTHWRRARDLQARFPKVKVEEDRIFITDGPVWTSAGMTAGIDLALAMVEKDLGADVARAVARQLVVYHRRAGGQSQFSALLELEPKSYRIQSALAYARRNLDRASDGWRARQQRRI